VPSEPSTSDFEDEELVDLFRRGRDDAFESLVTRYRHELFHFLIRFVGNRYSAEDIFQEAFLQVHQSIETFDVTRRFKPWLFTIAANKARDFLRRNNQRQAAALSAKVGGEGGDEREFLDLMQADLPMPQEEIERQELRERVRACAASMPDHLREILLMAYFHRFPYKDIADMLGIPLGTVKSRLHAAVATFAQMWKNQHGDAEE
jgi:RNA polymerase sigma-70 factor (ECF subfamily)